MLLKLNPSVSIASLYSVNFSNFEPQQQPMEPPPPRGGAVSLFLYLSVPPFHIRSRHLVNSTINWTHFCSAHTHCRDFL